MTILVRVIPHLDCSASLKWMQLSWTRSFFKEKIQKMGEDVVEAIVKLSGKLLIHKGAEEIEQKDQLDFLRRIGCDAVQGYVYSRPLPIEEFEQWAARYDAGLKQ